MNHNLLKGMNLLLIGMMGVGKTTVGQLLAQQLGYHFLDTDTLIEKVARKTIVEIFATEGEDSFRDLESQVLRELCAFTRTVIATGGGIILRRQNWSYLQHGLIIWLDAPIELLVKRLLDDRSRPLLQETDLRLKLTNLLEQRRPLYAQADLQIVIQDRQTPEEIMTGIMEQIPTVLKPRVST
jgi:shikimate kinase